MHSKKYSAYKTITWRIVATIGTFFLGWIFTSDIQIGLLLGGADAVLKTVFYYWHERAWERVKIN